MHIKGGENKEPKKGSRRKELFFLDKWLDGGSLFFDIIFSRQCRFIHTEESFMYIWREKKKPVWNFHEA